MNFRLALIAMVSLVASAASADTIDIPTDGLIIHGWGPAPPFQAPFTFGEVFTAPQTTMLDYSFAVQDQGSQFFFQSQVFAWNGSTTSGPALYTSQTFATHSAMTTYSFDPDISLVLGQQYIALVTPNPGGVPLGGSCCGNMAGSISAHLGNFRYLAGAPGIDTNWSSTPGDAAFHADFSGPGVPEPATWSMMMLGFLGLGAIVRHRRSATRPA